MKPGRRSARSLSRPRNLGDGSRRGDRGEKPRGIEEGSRPSGRLAGETSPPHRKHPVFHEVSRAEPPSQQGRKTPDLSAGWRAHLCPHRGIIQLRAAAALSCSTQGHVTVPSAVLAGAPAEACPTSGNEFFMGFRGPKAHSNRPGGLSHKDKMRAVAWDLLGFSYDAATEIRPAHVREDSNRGCIDECHYGSPDRAPPRRDPKRRHVIPQFR
jgi:hypothetical protein